MTRVASDSPPDPSFESLRSPTRFREVLRRGRRRTVGGLTVVSLANDVGPRRRVGLVAGRRLGPAVTRNRIKRRIRHAFRNVELEAGWDHVVIPTAQVARIPFATLVEWLRAGTATRD